MSKLSRQLQKIQLLVTEKRMDQPVQFAGVTLLAHTEQVSGALAGSAALQVDRTLVGPDIASADWRVFTFVATHFAPYTKLYAPQKDDAITFHGKHYLVTNVAPEDIADDSILVMCYAYCLEAI